MKVGIAAVTLIGFVGIAAMQTAPCAQETGPASRSVWDAVYTDEQVERGKEIFARECASCHADDLSGVDEAPALAGGAFLANWDGLTVGDLFERVRITMPPNKQGRLSRLQIVDILSYLMSFNSFPPGKTELDPKTEQLKQIRIEATKPKSKPNSGS